MGPWDVFLEVACVVWIVLILAWSRAREWRRGR